MVEQLQRPPGVGRFLAVSTSSNDWGREDTPQRLSSAQYRSTRIRELGAILWKARTGQLAPDWRSQLQAPHYGDTVHEMYKDADDLAVHDVRETASAAWEPTAQSDWRTSLEAWYVASLANLNDRLDLESETRQSSRRTRFNLLIHHYTTPPRMQNLIDQHHAQQAMIDHALTLNLATEIRDTDHLHAWYRAGLAAGGDPVDWRTWYQDRIAQWENRDLATRTLALLDDPAFCAELEALPRYWLN